MDSLSFPEDVAAVAPDFLSSVHLKNSPPHNSLDSTDSNKSSARVQDDTDGLVFARASNGCLWLCDANTLSPMENNQNVITNNENNTKADLMTMSTPPHLLSAALETSEDASLYSQNDILITEIPARYRKNEKNGFEKFEKRKKKSGIKKLTSSKVTRLNNKNFVKYKKWNGENALKIRELAIMTSLFKSKNVVGPSNLLSANAVEPF